ILNLHRQGKDSTYWNYAFGKRPQEELYDIEKDPQCLKNLAFDESYSSLKISLKDKLIGDLKQQGDPRVLGNGDVFDQYPYSGENVKNFYSRHMGGEKIKTHWVNPSDFEK
ncbi:MAG: heparan N-sulfatase, partial [Flavobacteriaceae bacterium]